MQRHREGIGTVLKLAAMGLAGARTDWPSAVGSNVHRNNYRMIGLNDKLGVAKEPDPDDGEYLLTVVKIDLTPPTAQ